MTLTRKDIADIAADLDADISSDDDATRYRPRYNVAPSDLHWIVVEPAGDRRVLKPAIWGYLASGRPLINVRGEQVASGGFRQAFDSRRCVVVTDGFFEWSAANREGAAGRSASRGPSRKKPIWYHRGDGGLVLLGGLTQSPPSPTSDARPRFTVLTTRPNQLVAKVHDRMPLVLSPDQVHDWLTAPASRAARLIAPAPEAALVATPVSQRVNSVKNDDPACLLPADADEGSDKAPDSSKKVGAKPAQRSLF